MTVSWTPPTHVAGGTALTVTKYNAEVVDDLQFLHDGFAFVVGSPDDLTQKFSETANQAVVCPFIPRDVITLAGLTYRSDTTAGNIDVGIYMDDGNGTTATKLKTSGSTVMPGGATAHTINFTASQTLESYTKYWFALSFSSASAKVLGTDGPYSLLAKVMATAFPLPTTITFGATPSVAPCMQGLA